MLSFGNSFCVPCIVAHTVGIVYTHVKPFRLTVDLVSRYMWFNATKFSRGILHFQNYK